MCLSMRDIPRSVEWFETLSRATSMIGITSYGAYIPRRRLQRKSIAEANKSFALAW